MKHILGYILLIVFLGYGLNSKAQKNNATDTIVKSFLKFEASFESGFAWEQRIGKASTLQFMAGIGIGGQTDKTFDLKARWIIIPIAEAQYRNYYNFKKRVTDNKNTENNSADFLYGKVQTLYPVKNQNYFGLVFGQGWGLQRPFNKHFGGTFHFGVLEHFYYDKPPYGGFNYLRLEPEVLTSIFYVF